MSFILDALKKSETDRQELTSSDLANVPTSHEAPRAPRWLWVLGILLAVNLVVLIGLLMRDDVSLFDRPDANQAVDGTTPPTDASFAQRIEQARDRQPVVVARAQPEPRRREATPVETPPETAPARPESLPEAASPPEFTLKSMPTAQELRANGTIQMPELHLDIHVYSEVPADRFVFINMVRHRENSRLAEGPLVREITPEGVILDYSGTEFLLPRK